MLVRLLALPLEAGAEVRADSIAAAGMVEYRFFELALSEAPGGASLSMVNKEGEPLRGVNG